MDLKVKLWKEERAICMQVLEQSDNGFGYICEETGMSIESSACPCIDVGGGTIFLRGEDAYLDFVVACAPFNSNKERDAYFKKMKTALTNFKNDLEEQKPEPNQDVFMLEVSND